MPVRLNYKSQKSEIVINQILAYLLGRPLAGATQRDIAAMLGVSHGTANRFIQHLVGIEEIHVEQKSRATNRGHLPAIYKYGPRIITRFPRNAIYQDLPLTFFRRSKDMSTTSNGTTGTQKPAAQMTDYLRASSFAPGLAGPYECVMVGTFDKGDGVTHMRWWNGEFWSWPLQPHHEDGKGAFYEPEADYFIRHSPEDHTVRFSWRGFTEDQEPL